MAGERVLIVDGDIALSAMLRARLKALDYLVDCAHSGKEALYILKSKWVDLIVLGIILQGGMHGFHLFTELKSKKKFSKIPIVIQSSKPAMKKMFETLGADAFFVKPYSVSAFLRKIEDILTS